MKKKNVDGFRASVISAISTLSVVSLTSGAVAMPQTENTEVAAPISLSSETLELTTESQVSLSESFFSLDSQEMELADRSIASINKDSSVTEVVTESSVVAENQTNPETETLTSQTTNQDTENSLEESQQQWLSIDEIVAQTQTNNVTETETVERLDEYSQINEPTVEPEPWLRIEQITNPEAEKTQTTENLDVYGEVVDPLDQINSVNQLRDVSPSDWAYEALRGLIDRYGCIQGYPDGTFRGNRAMTRYEFAAGLSACLDSLSEIIARSQQGQGQTTTGVSEADLETLRRLQQDFEAELATIGTRVDGLEAQLATLEDNQFSTTAKLRGFVTFGLIDYFSGEGETNAVLQDDVVLRISTSFTGNDLLEIGLIGTNTDVPEFDTPNNGRDVGSTREATPFWSFEGTLNNDVRLQSLDYTFTAFEAGDFKAVFTIFTQRGFGSGRFEFGPDGSAWLGPGRALSAFAARSPVFRLNGRTGIITRFQITPRIRIGGTYQANPGSNPDRGLFSGNYFAAAQMILNPTDNLALALTYANTYSLPGQFKFSRQRGNPNSNGFIGTALANNFDNAGIFLNRDVPVIANVYSLQGFYQLTPKINIGGFVTKIDARLIGAGDADIWSYAGILTLSDLFKEGNVGGLIVGMEPTLTNLTIAGDEIDSFDDDTSLHIEGYYQHNLSRNISVTPGFIWITAPNQDNDNEDIFLGIVRVVFAF
ncbi:MAG: iron uptake porin [Oscillatoria sp. PMC 1068.18]|nr:iron uptake porin [Oscillatoria sp. PMC 1076.18]MEC4988356.1 iron uptake porin [Oscillatoria sp. PMC 1068.18]